MIIMEKHKVKDYGWQFKRTNRRNSNACSTFPTDLKLYQKSIV